MTQQIQTGEPQTKLADSRAATRSSTQRSAIAVHRAHHPHPAITVGRREERERAITSTQARGVSAVDTGTALQAQAGEPVEQARTNHIRGPKPTANPTANPTPNPVTQGCGKLSPLSRPPAVRPEIERNPRPMTTRPPRCLKWWGSGSHRPGIAGVNPDDGRAAGRRKSPEGATESAGAGSQTTARDSIWVPRWLSRGRRELSQELQDARTLPLLRGPVSLVSCLVRNRGLDQSVSGGAEVSDGR